MTDEEYSKTQQQIIALGGLVNSLDLDGFLSRISLAHAVAPIADPTLYMRGMRRLGQIERLARTLQPFKKEVERQLQEGE